MYSGAQKTRVRTLYAMKNFLLKSCHAHDSVSEKKIEESEQKR